MCCNQSEARWPGDGSKGGGNGVREMTRGEEERRRRTVENPFSDGENGFAERGKRKFKRNFRIGQVFKFKPKRFKILKFLNFQVISK